MINNNIKRNIIYNSIGNFSYLFCQWLMTVLIVRLSGYDDAGVLSLAMTFSNSLYALASFGIRGLQTSDVNNEFSEKTYLYSRYLTCGVSFIGFSIFIAIMEYSIYEKLCIIAYLFFKTIEAYIDVLHGQIQKKGRMDTIGISFFIRAIAMIISFILGITITQNLFYTILLMNFTCLLIVIFYDNNIYNKNFNKNKAFNVKSLKNLLKKSLPLVLCGFMYNNFFVFPKTYFESITSSEMLGIYSSIASPVFVIQAVSSFIFNPLINVFAELNSENKDKEFNKLINKNLLFIGMIGVAGIIGIYFLGDFALEILYGKEILQYSYMLYSCLIVTLFMTMITFFTTILTVLRKFKALIITSTISIILSIVLSVIFINRYGMLGINYCLIVTFIIESFILLRVVYLKKKN